MTKKILIDEAVVKQALNWVEDAAVVLSHTSTAIQGGLGAEAEGVGGCSVKVLKDLREALEVNNRDLNALAEQQAAEPVARCPQDIIDSITAYGDARADQDAINAPTTSHERLADCIRLVRGVLTKQEPQCLPDGIRYKLPPLKLTGHQIMHLASMARDADALDAVWCIKELPPLSAMEPEGPCTGGIAATTEGQPGWALLNVYRNGTIQFTIKKSDDGITGSKT